MVPARWRYAWKTSQKPTWSSTSDRRERMNKETIEALHQIEKEKGVSFEILIAALEDALHSAYKKTAGAVPFSEVHIDRESGELRVFELVFPEGEEPDLEAEEDEDTEVDYSLAERHEITPSDFGRIAAQTAKQVIYQRIREAEQDMFFEEYSDRIGDIVTGIVQQSDNRYTLVDLGRVEALLPKSEQVSTERYEHGMRVKAVIKEVSHNPKGPPVILSRRSDEMVHRLFELEVPEMADGLVEIVGVAREPGYRAKISVVSHSDGVDPVGACVGPRGSRVRMVVSELRGEKIDIIPHNDEPARFVAKALSPARVREVIVDDEERQATVIVPDDQLSLAIGRDGQNARLAARLTGWRVDIKSETEFASEGEVEEYEGEEASDGHCLAVLSNGRRCPNAAIGDSHYCGLPTHQALARFETNQIAVLGPLEEAEVAILADVAADEGKVSEIVNKAEDQFVFGLVDDLRHLSFVGGDVGEDRDLRLLERAEHGDLVGLEAGQRLVGGQAAVVGVADRRVGAAAAVAEHRQAVPVGGFLALVLLDLPLGGELGLRLDVDPPPGEPGGEPGVLAVAADRQRELVVGDDHRRLPFLVVDDHLAHPRRRERLGDEARGLVVVGDDVDLLAAQLGDDHAHARAARPDAGADRVDAVGVGDDGDLRAVAGLARAHG